MRTTLDIAPDVLQAAKEIAVREKTTAGRVITQLVRSALRGGTSQEEPTANGFIYKNGIPTFPRTGGPLITLEQILTLKDDEDV